MFEHPNSKLHSHLLQPGGGTTSYHMPKLEIQFRMSGTRSKGSSTRQLKANMLKINK